MKIPLYIPCVGEEERKNLLDAFDSGWISSKGEYVGLFETKLKEYIGRKYCASVVNGTTALQLALLALDLPPNSGVICPSLTYISTANAIEGCGLVPVFVDCDACGVATIDNINEGITKAKRKGVDVKCVICVNLYGNHCDIDLIRKELDKDIRLIEDCAESFGTVYNGKQSGSGASDFSCFSFFGNKVITTGEGGAVLTDNKGLFDKALKIRCVGQTPGAPQRYLHSCLGFNFRMTNLACAIGCAQLDKANDIIVKKQNVYEFYKEHLNYPILLDSSDIVENHNRWMITCVLEDNPCREGLMLYLDTYGCENRPAFAPMHIFVNNYKKFIRVDNFPNTNKIASCGINLPSYPELTNDNLKFICDKVNEYIERYQDV